MADIERELTTFIVENFLFGNADQAPGPDDSFMDAGLIDSTGILELVTHIEGRYEITVSDEDLTPENLDSVGNIARFIERKRSV